MKFIQLSKEHQDHLIYMLNLKIEEVAQNEDIEGDLIYPELEEYEAFFDVFEGNYKISEKDGYPEPEHENGVKFSIDFDKNNKVILSTFEEDDDYDEFDF